MFRPKTILAIATVFDDRFEHLVNVSEKDGIVRSVRLDLLREFLFEHGYPRDLEEAAKALPRQPGVTKEFVLNLRGDQGILLRLATDILTYAPPLGRHFDARDTKALISALELDGYRWDGKRLAFAEDGAVDVEAQMGVLARLYRELGLPSCTRHTGSN